MVNKCVFIAILGAYYLSVPDIAAKEIGLILLIGQITSFLFEIPSGYAPDKFSQKSPSMGTLYLTEVRNTFLPQFTVVLLLLIT